jgi:hypothetical protein
MVKRIVLVALLVDPMASLPSLRAAQSAQPLPSCLHGSLEQPVHELRRQQALRMARQINLAEGPGVVPLPPQPRRFRPLDQLPNLPPAPADFRLQFYTDGSTYTFSLKDTADPCRYVIFSDQDQAIYEAIAARSGVRVVPAEVP